MTNKATGRWDRVERKVRWRGRAFQILLREHVCRVGFSVLPGIRLRMWAQAIGSWVFLIAGFWCIVNFSVMTGFLDWFLFGFVAALGVVAGCCQFLRVPNLKVVQYEDDRYWIRGFSQEYLSRLDRDLDPWEG